MITKYIIIFWAVLGTGCAIRKNLQTSFNPVNKPVIDTGSDPTHGTKYCSPDANGNFDDGTVATDVTVLGDGSAQAEGGGCVLRPIREVWAVLNNMTVMKFDAADSFDYTRTINPKPDFTHLYTVTYSKSTTIGEIHWTIEWFHGFDLGTFLAPLQVNIEYQRTDGTSMIPIWKGGIVLDKVRDSVTSITVLNDFKAMQSSSDNEDSARSALVEMVGHARNGAADWTALNTGFKDNPSQPDAPVANGVQPVGVFCVKDKNGQYPLKPDSDSGSQKGVSWSKLRACIMRPLAAVETALKDPNDLLWANASSDQLLSSDATSSKISYMKSGSVFTSAINWDMTWNYKDADNQSTVTYQIDPATAAFPVWNGQITLTAVDTNVTAIELDNNLLTDVVSQSNEQNQRVSEGLLHYLLTTD